jgi:hypothetical protein
MVAAAVIAAIAAAGLMEAVAVEAVRGGGGQQDHRDHRLGREKGVRDLPPGADHLLSFAMSPVAAPNSIANVS